MTLAVTDVRSNSNDQIAHAAKVIGRSKARRAIFEELHRTKRRIKTVSQLEAATGLTRQRVLDDARKLAHEQIVKATKRDGEITWISRRRPPSVLTASPALRAGTHIYPQSSNSIAFRV